VEMKNKCLVNVDVGPDFIAMEGVRTIHGFPAINVC
jgi:nicotinamidase-related amidase